MRKAKLNTTALLIFSIVEASSSDSLAEIPSLDYPCTEDFLSIIYGFIDCTNELKRHPDGRSAANDLLSLERLMDNFCFKHDELVYNEFMRKLLQQDVSGSLYSALTVIHLLLVEWYARGMQASGSTRTRISALCNGVDATVLELALVLLANSNFRMVALDSALDKSKRIAVSVFKMLNGERVLDSLYKDTQGYCSLLLQALFTKCCYAAFVNLFLEEDRPSMAVRCILVDRQNFSEDNYAFASLYRLLQCVDKNFLQYRHFFVREKGVLIHFSEQFDSVSSIFVKEIHDRGFHGLFIEYDFGHNTDKRNLILNFEDLSSCIMQLMFEKDITVIVCILCWLGLYERLIDSITSAGLDSNLADYLCTFVDYFKRFVARDNLFYEEPVSWNYDHRGKHLVKKNPSDSSTLVYRIVSVGRYTRRLPLGSHPSAKAVALAEKYCMKLEDGYTFVEQFERKQSIKVCSKPVACE